MIAGEDEDAWLLAFDRRGDHWRDGPYTDGSGRSRDESRFRQTRILGCRSPDLMSPSRSNIADIGATGRGQPLP
jgi:hypothetical protein